MSIDVIEELKKLALAYKDNPPTAGATLIEACIAKLEKLTETDYVGDLYRTDYEVEGCDEFPVDMLRYTSSWPRNEIDASIVRGLLGGSDNVGVSYTVTLSKYHRDPEPNLANDRWQSKFNWTVVRVIDTMRL